jgi:NADPH-dependent curcumin reductase CurA
MLSRLKQGGVVIQCGLISDYNDLKPTVLQSEHSNPCPFHAYPYPAPDSRPPHQITTNSSPPDYFQIIAMRLSVRGFIVLDFASTFTETIKLFIQALQDGKLKISNEESEQVVDTKFEDVPKTWLKLFDGGNMGKLVTKIV